MEGKVDSPDTPILNGVKFETCLKIKHKGGQIFRGKDYLELIGVKTATLFIVSNSSYYFKDFKTKIKLTYGHYNQKHTKALRRHILKIIKNFTTL